MKQQIFTQEWETMGSVSTVKGKIVVTMNYTTKNITAHNHSTHDDIPRTIGIHKIVGYINGKVWWNSGDLDSENIVLSESERCKKQMQSDMDNLANTQPIKTFADKMKGLGF